MKKTRRQYSTEQTVKKLRDAEAAVNHFLEKYDAKYPKACECPRKDREALLTFYNFPPRTKLSL